MTIRILLWALVGSSEAYSLLSVSPVAQVRRGGSGACMNEMKPSVNDFRFGTGHMALRGQPQFGIGTPQTQGIEKTENFRHGTGRRGFRGEPQFGIGVPQTQGVEKTEDFRFGTGRTGFRGEPQFAIGTPQTQGVEKTDDFRFGTGRKGFRGEPRFGIGVHKTQGITKPSAESAAVEQEEATMQAVETATL